MNTNDLIIKKASCASSTQLGVRCSLEKCLLLLHSQIRSSRRQVSSAMNDVAGHRIGSGKGKVDDAVALGIPEPSESVGEAWVPGLRYGERICTVPGGGN